jgi:hypothetical protein
MPKASKVSKEPKVKSNDEEIDRAIKELARARARARARASIWPENPKHADSIPLTSIMPPPPYTQWENPEHEPSFPFTSIMPPPAPTVVSLPPFPKYFNGIILLSNIENEYVRKFNDSDTSSLASRPGTQVGLSSRQTSFESRFSQSPYNSPRDSGLSQEAVAAFELQNPFIPTFPLGRGTTFGSARSQVSSVAEMLPQLNNLNPDVLEDIMAATRAAEAMPQMSTEDATISTLDSIISNIMPSVMGGYFRAQTLPSNVLSAIRALFQQLFKLIYKFSLGGIHAINTIFESKLYFRIAMILVLLSYFEYPAFAGFLNYSIGGIWWLVKTLLERTTGYQKIVQYIRLIGDGCKWLREFGISTIEQLQEIVEQAKAAADAAKEAAQTMKDAKDALIDLAKSLNVSVEDLGQILLSMRNLFPGAGSDAGGADSMGILERLATTLATSFGNGAGFAAITSLTGRGAQFAALGNGMGGKKSKKKKQKNRKRNKTKRK